MFLFRRLSSLVEHMSIGASNGPIAMESSHAASGYSDVSVSANMIN